MPKIERKRVAIVGSGASGISAARQALDYDIEPVIFETSDKFGGLWRYKPTETDEPSVMKSTIINTSKEMTAFSDFPPPAEFANYMHNKKLLEYFASYVEAFKLEQYIRYKHYVNNIYRSENYQSTGKWMVSYQNENNESKLEEFDAVLMCNGHHTKPHFPAQWPEQDKFRGKITHAHSYKNGHGYDDKIVAVIGLGNSGLDVAVELSRVAKQVYLISRRGAWIFYRNGEHGVPTDLTINRRLYNTLFNTLPLWLMESMIKRSMDKRFDHAKYNLQPKHGIFSAHITLSDELLNRLSCGSIIVKPNIKSFTETNLVLEDDSVLENVDEIVCCTGYSFDFPIVENGNLISVKNNQVNTLYKFMYPLETADHNTLAVIGLIQPIGSIMPISELQARVFFDVLTGGSNLPNVGEMKHDIEKKEQDMKQRYVNSPRHTIQVDYIPFMDELANLIGCVPPLWRYAVTDPVLAWHLFFGPNAPYAYRLIGPKPWDKAREMILTLEDRVECGMRHVKRLNKDCQTNCAFIINIIIFGIFGLLITLLWSIFL